MTPAVVVDIGNTRMKWGRVEEGRIAEHVSLPLDEPVEWIKALDEWSPVTGGWLIAGVVPRAVSRLTKWLETRPFPYKVLDNTRFYAAVSPDFFTTVKEPDHIGIDRLINSYAAFMKSGRRRALAIVSVGTAMTVDFVAANGQHIGGAILPGPHMMAKSLNDHTALLPLIEPAIESPPAIWGTTTKEAIELGVAAAIQGAADQLVRDWAKKCGSVGVYITGGDARFFRNFEFTARPESVAIDKLLTLDGLRLIAGKLP